MGGNNTDFWSQVFLAVAARVALFVAAVVAAGLLLWWVL